MQNVGPKTKATNQIATGSEMGFHAQFSKTIIDAPKFVFGNAL